MRDMRSSAAYRIAFTYSGAFALAIVLLGVIVYFAADADFRRQQDATITKESADIVQSYQDEGMPDVIETIKARGAGSATNGFGYAVFDRQGRRIAGSLITARPQLGWRNIHFLDPKEGPDPARALATALPGGEMLVVAVDTESLERIDRTILALFAGAFVLILAVGFGGALLLGGYLRRQIERVSETAQAIVSGDLERRIPVGSRGDEFDRLAESLNVMLDRIVQLLENLRQVSSDVAHDLRTPLARLRRELEFATDGPADLKTLQNGLSRALVQCDELLTLFAAILRIAEVEGGALARGFATVNLSSLVDDLCESYAPAVSDDGRELRCDIERDILVRGDRELLAQSVINLLDNAQRHTPEGTRIVVDLKGSSDGARLTVADDGSGVPAEDRERIVRRFFRLESSRTTPGHGLGLNLVSAVAAAHAGKLRISDNRPGLRATITLPRLLDR